MENVANLQTAPKMHKFWLEVLKDETWLLRKLAKTLSENLANWIISLIMLFCPDNFSVVR